MRPGNYRRNFGHCQTAASYCACAQSQRAYAADRNANGQREAFEDALDSAPTINAEQRSCRNPEDCDMSAVQRLSWGRYPAHPQTLHAVHWRCDLAHTLSAFVHTLSTTLPFGNGRSYGDSCLAASVHALHMRALDRFIAADWEKRLLIAEAGLTLEEILTLCMPRGWFLPVTPGTQYVTLGGALANDVHGKNHHVRGTLGRHVRRFSLIRSDRLPLICAPEENTELFTATIGGLGMTGLIEWVELQLMPIQSSQIDTLTCRFGALDEFFVLSREFDARHEYSVAWIDCLAKGASSGRGVWMAGDHAPDGPLTISRKRRWTAPCTLPVSAVNS